MRNRVGDHRPDCDDAANAVARQHPRGVVRVMATPLVALALLAFAAAGAAQPKPKFTATWKAPGVGRLPGGQKVVGLIVSDDMSLRMSAEEALASELTAKGAQGVAAYRVIPAEEVRNTESAKGWFTRAGAAGVVLMRLVDVTTEKTPSVVMWESGTQYGSLWSYYPYAWGASYSLTPSRTNVTLVVETLAFDIAGNRLVWGGTSESTNPAGAQALVKSIVDAVASEMKKAGLIGG